jgi:hypothetical protein
MVVAPARITKLIVSRLGARPELLYSNTESVRPTLAELRRNLAQGLFKLRPNAAQ